jgi:sec-independent protein translocase protein TatC
VQGVVDGERRMTIVEHLEELRRVLIISLAAWLVGSVVAFIFNGFILSLLLRPLKVVLANTHNHIVNGAIFTSPTEGLTVPIKIATIIGFILALPVVLWQVWWFVSPGLRPIERKFTGPFIASAIVLFGCGAAFAYFVMPIGLGFLAGFLGTNAIYFPDIDQYFSFFLLLVVIFGVTFEMPVVLVLLGVLRIISSQWLRKRRKVAIVLIIAAAAIVTPGADPFTPTFLAVPLILLYEVSILVLSRVFHR